MNCNGKRILLIINPRAGMTITNIKIEKLTSKLEARGGIVTPYLTGYAKHCERLVRELGQEHDVVMCSGGDGTLNEAVTGLHSLAGKPKISYIPTGTTNVFGRTFRLPSTSDAAVAVLCGGLSKKLDYGIMNGNRVFTFVCSFGAFTNVSYSTSQDTKNVLGMGAYLFDGIATLRDIRPYRAKITTAAGDVYEDEFIFGAVTNAPQFAGVLKIPQKVVNPSDGLFELMLIKYPKTPYELTDTLHQLIYQQYDRSKTLLLHSSRFTMEFEENTPFTVDGEYAGEHKTVIAENKMRAMELIVPPDTITETLLGMIPEDWLLPGIK